MTLRGGRIIEKASEDPEHLLKKAWQMECEVVTDYMPPYPTKYTKPKLVVTYTSMEVPVPCGGEPERRTSFLRHSHGPAQGFFWDCYGDDFMTPALALLAIMHAPHPRGWDSGRT